MKAFLAFFSVNLCDSFTLERDYVASLLFPFQKLLNSSFNHLIWDSQRHWVSVSVSDTKSFLRLYAHVVVQAHTSWQVRLKPQVSPWASSCPPIIGERPVLLSEEWNWVVGDLGCLRAASQLYNSVSMPTQKRYSLSMTNETESDRGREILSSISHFFKTCFSLFVLHWGCVIVCGQK